MVSAVRIHPETRQQRSKPLPQDESIARISLRARDGSVRAYTIVDAADYKWARQYSWHLTKNGYAVRDLPTIGSARTRKRKIERLHRVLVNAGPGQTCDHINRDKLDNRRDNLRLVTHQINVLNTGLRSTNLTGYRGVSYDKKNDKYSAEITVNYKYKRIGRFATAEEAAKAFDEVARLHRGEFARLNFPHEE